MHKRKLCSDLEGVGVVVDGGGGDNAVVQREVVQLRTSARMLRRKEEEERRESEFDETPAATESGLEGASSAASSLPGTADGGLTVERPRRAWEQWSVEDKSIFFEGLNEFGKNFEAIQTHFQNKFKKKSIPAYKNKDQIRTFYYRTWHKICKHITFPEQLKKSSRELYGLINYGEWRRKVGLTLDEKNGAKLQELVFQGHTSVKVKGKTYRLRTPICRALKRLNNKLDSSNSKKCIATKASATPLLPNRVMIDLKPQLAEDFYKVHSCFMNPAVSITCNLSDRLVSLFDYLEKKWTRPEQKLKTCLRKSLQQHHLDSNKRLKEELCDGEASEELVLMAIPGAKIRQPKITAIAPVTSTTLSLSHLQSKMEDAFNKKDDGTQENGESHPTDVAGPSSSVPHVDAALSVTSQWTRGDAGSLTIGELFLMLGSSEQKKIELCYSWKRSRHSIDSRKTTVMSSLKRMAMAELSARRGQQRSNSSSSPGFHRNNTCRNNPSSSTHAAVIVGTQDSATDGCTSNAAAAASGEFRRPADPPVRLPVPIVPQSTQTQSFRQQMDRLMPKYTNRRGRPSLTRKNNVNSRQMLSSRPIQRKPYAESTSGGSLRLLPAATDNSRNTISLPLLTIQQPSHTITLQSGNHPLTIFLPQNATPLTAQILQQPPPADAHHLLDIPQIVIQESSHNDNCRAFSPISDLFNDSDSLGADGARFSLGDLTSSSTPTKRGSDSFLDSVLENSNSSSSSVLRTPPRHRPTPPSSPSRVVGESWLPDLSLSSFLNLTESPVKNASNGGSSSNGLGFNEDSSHSTHSTSSEVERQFMSMISENSVDFTRKFAGLASHVTDGD